LSVLINDSLLASVTDNIEDGFYNAIRGILSKDYERKIESSEA